MNNFSERNIWININFAISFIKTTSRWFDFLFTSKILLQNWQFVQSFLLLLKAIGPSSLFKYLISKNRSTNTINLASVLREFRADRSKNYHTTRKTPWWANKTADPFSQLTKRLLSCMQIKLHLIRLAFISDSLTFARNAFEIKICASYFSV